MSKLTAIVIEWVDNADDEAVKKEMEMWLQAITARSLIYGVRTVTVLEQPNGC